MANYNPANFSYPGVKTNPVKGWGGQMGNNILGSNQAAPWSAPFMGSAPIPYIQRLLGLNAAPAMFPALGGKFTTNFPFPAGSSSTIAPPGFTLPPPPPQPQFPQFGPPWWQR